MEEVELEDKIRPLVVALNKIKVPTIASCEGHVPFTRTRKPFPWIAIDFSNMDSTIFHALIGIMADYNSIARYPWILVPKLSYTDNERDYVNSLWLTPYESNVGGKEELLRELQRSVQFLVNTIEARLARH